MEIKVIEDNGFKYFEVLFVGGNELFFSLEELIVKYGVN
jgi:hypothetical protein